MLVLTVILHLLAALSLVLLVRLHSGKGGGLSDMFGGGMTQSLNTSGVAQKNLVRLTTATAVVWALSIAAYALTMRFADVAV
jgi:preprotein translocase subunit SecG